MSTDLLPDLMGNFILQFQYVTKIAFVGVCPEMTIRGRVQKLGCDSYSITGAGD
ncbi:MAG TPA: hypothetical protein VG498_05745 [Terriglobales bacterium]|nr:hypothetical protein [Terriglobales bacterium]